MLYDKKALEGLKNVLIEKKLTLAVAKSVTSGHLQAAFSSVTDTMQFFQGGITAYNLGQKVRHLNVNAIEAEASNCVSANVAKEMALSVCQLFATQVGISVTGYATPVPELGITKLFAFYAIAKGKRIIASGKIYTTKTEPVKAQVNYCNQVLNKALTALK